MNSPKKTMTIFDTISMDQQLTEEFNDFFSKWNLDALFTNEHRASAIRVSDTEMRATVNTGGAYRQDLIELADVLQYAQDNKMYESAVFKLIYGAKTMTKLMNNVRKVNRYVKNVIQTRHVFNTWNIVFYNKQLL